MSLNRREKYGADWGVPSAESPTGAFINRSAPGSEDGSYLEKDWANDMYDGLHGALLSAAGIQPNGIRDTAVTSQVFEALLSLLPPIGTPFPCPSSTVPDGYLECNGQSFDVLAYPRLALMYPTGKLPDLRGMFLRGWDNGRGIDPGRGILTEQDYASENATGSFRSVYATNAYSDGVFEISQFGSSPAKLGSEGTDPGANYSVSFDLSKQIKTANEVRPKNVAVMWIVKKL